MSEDNNTILQYLSGNGWLVFSGGNDALSDVRAQALSRAKVFGQTVYISLADDSGDALMDDMEDLGARTGFFIDLQYDSDEEIIEQLETSSMIVVEIGNSVDALYRLLRGAAAQGISEAYKRGAIVLLEGLTINLFGRWVVSDNGQLLEGLDWVKNAFIEPESMGAEDSRAVRAVLAEIADAGAINVPIGSALALGPNGQVELWGEQLVTISLGRQFVQ